MVSPFTGLFLYTIISLLQHLIIATSTPHINGIHRQIFPIGNLRERSKVHRTSSRQSAFTGLRLHDSDERQVLMINGTADDAFEVACYPEPGFNSSSYKIVFKSDNQLVLNESADITWSHIFGDAVSNISVLVDFNKFPGTATLSIEARRIRDESLFDSLSVQYLAAGLVIYRNDTNEIVSGAGRMVTIQSYRTTLEEPQVDFMAFAQYLNGSDSRSAIDKPIPLSDSFSYSDIRPNVQCSGQIIWDQDVCSVTDGTWNGSETVLQNGCGMGFASEYDSVSRTSKLHFAVFFEKYRVGECALVLNWPKFTLTSIFEDEEYTTFLQTEIIGKAPIVVRRIEPSNPFSSKGGEQLQVEMINTADVNVTSFNVHNARFFLMKDSRHFITGPDDYYETATFLTEPGNGRNLPWTISASRLSETNDSSEPVAVIDETGFLFSYDDHELTLESISPSIISDAGGDEIVLKGQFAAFSLNATHHNVLLGHFPVDKKNIISFSSSEIKFLAPPRASVSMERVLTVTVQVEHSFSNGLSLRYSPSLLTLRGYAFGASFDFDDRTHVVSSCGQTTFMVTAENFNDNEVSYKWNVTHKAKLDGSTISIMNESSSSYPFDGVNLLELPNSIFPEHDVVYSIVAEADVGNLSSSYTFAVQKSRNIVAGVTLIKPESRFRITPAVNLRIMARVDIPECFRDPTDLIYEWYYQTEGSEHNNASISDVGLSSIADLPKKSEFQHFVFSHENSTGPPHYIVSPMRLGRELMVPRQFLSYGVHVVQLTVRDRSQPKFFGNALTTVNILQSKIIAQIGNGSTTRTVSDSEPLQLTADGSYDPDIFPSTQQVSNLTFGWNCTLLPKPDLSEGTLCDDSLLPLMNETGFIISSEVLQEKTRALQTGDAVYIRYSLTVQKGQRYGETSQLLILLKSNGKMMVQGERVDVLNSRGEPIDKNRIQFWEEVILQPIAPEGTEWSFRLDLPYEEGARFLADNRNLISSPGYYTLKDKAIPFYDRSPLGILADKLVPHQRYHFTITFRRDGMISREVTLQLTTIELPRLLLPALGRSSGTVDTIFQSSATTSFKTYGTFSYHFYLIDVGNPSTEFCVDGCTGANIVRFKITKPGHYTLQCRLLSSDGRKSLVHVNNPKTIVVSARSSALSFEDIENMIWKDYYLGNDGAVNQRTFHLAEEMNHQSPSNTSLLESERAQICANVTSLWSNLARGFAQRDLPNTARAQNYVRIAISCLRLRCVEREDTLYDLLHLIDTTIFRIPPGEARSVSSSLVGSGPQDLEMTGNLITFYNLSMSFAISAMASGSSRERFVPGEGEVSSVIIDLGELWTKHVTVASASGQVCGWEATYTSHVSEPSPNSVAVTSRANTQLGINTMRVAVRCTAAQGTSMTTPFASFEWCDAVYGLTGNERKMITLAETLDFPYFSRIQGQNKTDSARLVSVDITTLVDGNRLVSALSESMVSALAQESEAEVKSCYRVGMMMKSDDAVRSEKGTFNIPFVMQPRKTFGQILTHSFEGNYYGRRTEGIIVTPETRNRTDFVTVRSNTLGLYGVERANDHSTIDKLDDTLEGTGLELSGILIGVIILILILALCLMAVIFLVLSLRKPPMLETTEPYIDRDAWGRGDVRLQVGGNASAPVTTLGASNKSESSRQERNILDDDEDVIGPSRQRVVGDTAPR